MDELSICSPFILVQTVPIFKSFVWWFILYTMMQYFLKWWNIKLITCFPIHMVHSHTMVYTNSIHGWSWPIFQGLDNQIDSSCLWVVCVDHGLYGWRSCLLSCLCCQFPKLADDSCLWVGDALTIISGRVKSPVSWPDQRRILNPSKYEATCTRCTRLRRI